MSRILSLIRRKVKGQISIDFSQHLQQAASLTRTEIELDSGNEKWKRFSLSNVWDKASELKQVHIWFSIHLVL